MVRSVVGAVVAATVAAGSAGQKVGGSKGTLEFAPVKNYTHFGANVVYSDKVTKNGKETDLLFTTLGRSGDVIDGVTFGALLDKDLEQIYENAEPVVSTDPDFTSILYPKDGSEGVFTLTHFERPNPGMAYLTRIDIDSETCEITPDQYWPVNNFEEGGIWTPCSGSVTGWGTHLGSEEYEPDARWWEEKINTEDADYFNAPIASLPEDFNIYIRDQMSFFGYDVRAYENVTGADNLPTLEQWKNTFFPYKYGHPWQFTLLDNKGNYQIEKLYALGRVAFELCAVSPDDKTVYCTDDGTNVGFFRFVADEAEDLNAGALSCAKFKQTSDVDGGEFDVEWIQLASVANAKEELASLSETLVFSDIFEIGEIKEDLSGCVDETFTPIQANGVVECLKLTTDTEQTKKLAAFFETRRYCAMMGGTHEFTKWEGLNFDKEGKKWYTALSAVQGGMVESSAAYDIFTADDVRVAENKCGCIYSLGIDNDYTITSMKSEVCGANYTATPGEDEDKCATDAIANPDNVVVIEGYNELFIAEDSGNHRWNYLWSYNLGNKELTRVAGVPREAEVTGPTGYHFPNVANCDYFLFVNQHPALDLDIRAGVHFLASKTGETIEDGDDDVEEEEEEEGMDIGGEVALIFFVFIFFGLFFMYGVPRLFPEESSEELSTGTDNPVYKSDEEENDQA